MHIRGTSRGFSEYSKSAFLVNGLFFFCWGEVRNCTAAPVKQSALVSQTWCSQILICLLKDKYLF